MIAHLKFAHFDDGVVAGAKKVAVIITTEVIWIILNTQHDMMVIASTAWREHRC